MFKVNNKDTRMISITLFGCFYCWTYFTPFSRVSIVDREQVNVSWELGTKCMTEKDRYC